jgi:hypothetical protein
MSRRRLNWSVTVEAIFFQPKEVLPHNLVVRRTSLTREYRSVPIYQQSARMIIDIRETDSEQSGSIETIFDALT